MRLLDKVSGGWSRGAVALTAALAVGAIAAPFSIADEKQDTTQAAKADKPDRLLTTPELPRISDGPYVRAQFCTDPKNKPLVTTGSPTFGATLESVSPPGTVESPEELDRPRRKVIFEVNDADGKRVLTKKGTSLASHTAAYQVPEGKLANGEYSWRMRVEDGPAVSEWTEWCGFSVRLAK